MDVQDRECQDEAASPGQQVPSSPSMSPTTRHQPSGSESDQDEKDVQNIPLPPATQVPAKEDEDDQVIIEI